MTHAEIIEALGDYETLARQLGRDPSSVFRWKKTGIPPGMWLPIAKLAARHKINITIERLARDHPVLGDNGNRSPKARVATPTPGRRSKLAGVS